MSDITHPPQMAEKPAGPYLEVRPNDDDTIDEIIVAAEGVIVHLEQMDDSAYYLGVYIDGEDDAQFSIYRKKKQIIVKPY